MVLLHGLIVVSVSPSGEWNYSLHQARQRSSSTVFELPQWGRQIEPLLFVLPHTVWERLQGHVRSRNVFSWLKWYCRGNFAIIQFKHCLERNTLAVRVDCSLRGSYSVLLLLLLMLTALMTWLTMTSMTWCHRWRCRRRPQQVYDSSQVERQTMRRRVGRGSVRKGSHFGARKVRLEKLSTAASTGAAVSRPVSSVQLPTSPVEAHVPGRVVHRSVFGVAVDWVKLMKITSASAAAAESTATSSCHLRTYSSTVEYTAWLFLFRPNEYVRTAQAAGHAMPRHGSF